MAEAKGTNCSGCCQPYTLNTKTSCCPQGCDLCKIKNCKERGKCKCNICTCGCQDNVDLNKGNQKCKDSSCVGCKVICSKLPDGDRCRCTFCDCGCEVALKKGKRCYEEQHNSKCKNCHTKCKNSKDGTCICYLCSCGCNGVNCQCCKRCNPETRCQGTGKCDAEEIHGDNCPKGKCKEKPGSCSEVTCMCKDMGIEKRDDLCECKCRCEQQCPRILCDQANNSIKRRICSKSTKDECTCECECSCNACGKYYGDKGNLVKVTGTEAMHVYVIGGCRFKCTNCGRLCDQDRCMNWIRVIVIGLIILASLFVLRAIFPQKFRAIMTKIRATFASSSVHSDRSLSNLVGDKIPEEVNIDRYPAFRPRTYAGLA